MAHARVAGLLGQPGGGVDVDRPGEVGVALAGRVAHDGGQVHQPVRALQQRAQRLDLAHVRAVELEARVAQISSRTPSAPWAMRHQSTPMTEVSGSASSRRVSAPPT